MALDCVGESPETQRNPGVTQMSKGIERKKETKKKAAKSLMEKRAAKAEKRNQKKQWGAA